ncbi:hypothetical protein DACRYDRAFT_113531 [Dacryopinax primogenitus]|uniref:Uncharacterized protein n=1 Tax=Dacryopinax primogenitus (strain DJM 731) TaxID=1858805 RepID=M5GAL3_DACPD|nr:uncharacterized protein DACRYDRAFT_113531 [Dacryopinax primogenitus]EJU05400.1 hypothetical protein DACRYDRAFT_113531 [Dacryopinax primogenitus]
MTVENSIWNLTVLAISPMFTYNAFTGDNSTGWGTTCTDTGSYVCDSSTAHITSVAGSVSVSFNGSGIAFYGNATHSMTVMLSIDGGGNATESFDAANQVLGSTQGLSPGMHTVVLNTSPSSPDALLSFTYAVISHDTGLANVQVGPYVFDDLGTDISYDSYWLEYPNFSDSTEVNGANTFHASHVFNSTASLSFAANAVLLYGPCSTSTGLFKVDVTPGPGTVMLTTTAFGTQVNMYVFQRCLRYFAMGLDTRVGRNISITNMANGTLATLDYIEVIWFSSGASGGGANVSAIVGGITGGLVFLLLLSFLFLRHRHKLAAQPQPIRLLEQANSDSSLPLATGSVQGRLVHPRPENHILSAGERPSIAQAAVLPADALVSRSAPLVLVGPSRGGGTTASPSELSPQTQRFPTSSTVLSSAATLSAPNDLFSPEAPLPSLQQLSSDVNRIIAELSRLAQSLAPGDPGEENLESELDSAGREQPGFAPPAYEQSHGGNQY